MNCYFVPLGIKLHYSHIIHSGKGGNNLSNQLQDALTIFSCSVLNYTNNKIIVEHFYSEERYTDYLNGKNCKAGTGLFNVDEVLEFNKLNDNTLVIVEKNGVETARYKYIPIFKATMEYKGKNIDGKKVNRYLTFKIRKNQFNGTSINFIDNYGVSLDFYNVQAVKNYLTEKYGIYKLTDWSVFIGQNDFN